MDKDFTDSSLLMVGMWYKKRVEYYGKKFVGTGNGS